MSERETRLANRRIVISLTLAFLILGAGALYYFRGTNNPPAFKGPSSGGAAASVPITTSEAAVENFMIRRRTIGIMESPATVVVKSRIESQVLEQHVRDGQLVKKGDLLFSLDDGEVRAAIARDEAQLAKDQAAADRTATDQQRYEQLTEKNAASVQRLDQAIADNKIALATVEADRAQLRTDNLRLGYTKIVAPIGGRIGSVRVSPGNLVSVNDPTGLVTITQIRPIRVAFTLAERDLAALRKASRAEPAAAVRVYTPGTSEALATGALDFVDSAVDATSGTISAKARFANEDFVLWPGMYVDIEIDLDIRPNTVMIPTVAVQSGQQGPFVFVAKQDKAEMRAVEFAGTEGDRTAVASGVSQGERVIVEGQMRLTDGTRVVDAAPARPRTGDKPVTGAAAADAKASQ